MMRIATIPFALFCVVSLATAASGQHFLEQLERTLDIEAAARENARTALVDEIMPGDATASDRPSDVVVRQPGYLGLIAQINSDNVQVEALRPDAPAQRAGLREGDIIKAIDGRAIKTLDEMGDALAAKYAGDQIVVIVQRDGLLKKARVTLSQKTAATAVAPPVPTPTPAEPLAEIDSLGALQELERMLEGEPEIKPSKTDAAETDDAGRDALRKRIAAMEARMENLKRRIGNLERSLDETSLGD